jgi:hypothetical protein
MSVNVNEIPILKRLTALEPEMELPVADSPTLEVSESSGEEADIDTDTESDTDTDTESESDMEIDTKEETVATDILNSSIGLPVRIWLSVGVLWLAYMWGIAYALSPVRDISERKI